MRQPLTLAFTLVAVASAAAAETAEQTLTRLELAAEQATVDRNRAVLEATFGDDFKAYGCSGDKMSGKKELLDGALAPDYALLDYKYSPFTIRVFGPTATVQGVVVETSRWKGVVSRKTMSWLDVWALRDGAWKWVANECAIVPDKPADAAASLLEADKALSAKSRAEGFVPAYASAMAPDARKFDEGSEPVIGEGPIKARMAKYKPSELFAWIPEEAVVADSGELGFTWGHWEAQDHDKDQHLVVERGLYFDVWRRGADGVWRWISDTGYALPRADKSPS
jgi:ketosteroid isomerase-like protein